jgi:hypothetical protein
VVLLPADDPLDEDGDGDGEDREADGQLVEERHCREQVRGRQAVLPCGHHYICTD